MAKKKGIDHFTTSSIGWTQKPIEKSIATILPHYPHHAAEEFVWVRNSNARRHSRASRECFEEREQSRTENRSSKCTRLPVADRRGSARRVGAESVAGLDNRSSPFHQRQWSHRWSLCRLAIVLPALGHPLPRTWSVHKSVSWQTFSNKSSHPGQGFFSSLSTDDVFFLCDEFWLAEWSNRLERSTLPLYWFTVEKER